MRRLAIFFGSALLAAAQSTSPTGFGRMIYPGTGGPGAKGGTISSGVGGAGFGRAIYPGTGAPYAVRPGSAPAFVGVPPQGPPHQQHGRSTIVPFPVFYGGGYYGAFDVPNATPYYEDRDNRAPVVIINQNYQPEPINPVLRDYSQTQLPPAAPRRERVEVDPHSEDPTLYQIAMTDGSVFEAVGYWVEGDVLHYLTLEGNNNLATLDLVDRERSLKLNQERKVAFKLPKR
jgi:hypothetical protein